MKVTCQNCDNGLENLTSETPIQSCNNKTSGSGSNHSDRTTQAFFKLKPMQSKPIVNEGE